MRDQRLVRLGNIQIPEGTKAILWDMDGVLIDSLGLDLVVCNSLLQDRLGTTAVVGRDFIQSIFAYDVPTFWRLIFERVGESIPASDVDRFYDEILVEYNARRQSVAFGLCPGVSDLLTECRVRGLSCAVVSNNPQSEVERILSNAGLQGSFDVIVGNDTATLRKKPAPDTYLFAANQCDADPRSCVVIEDSELGIAGGLTAQCYTIGVATGALSWDSLQQLQGPGRKPHAIYQSLE